MKQTEQEKTINRFERLVKNPNKDSLDILRAYWNYGANNEGYDDDVATIIDKLIWKHRRKVWYHIEFEWTKVEPVY